MAKSERRFIDGLELRTNADGSKTAVGHASVFYDPNDAGTQYQLGSRLVERVSPAAFSRAIQEGQNVRALFNHDPNQVLGSTKSGTLRLSVDAKGLRYEVDLPDTTAGRDLAANIERGDVSGSSFSFRTIKDSFAKGADFNVRTLEDVDLYDVGPVTFPAYQSATAGMRADGSAEAEQACQAWIAKQEADAVKIRARAVEVG